MINLYVRVIQKYLCICLFAFHTDALGDFVTRSTDTSFFFLLYLYIFYLWIKHVVTCVNSKL